MLPEETALAEGVTSWPADWQADDGADAGPAVPAGVGVTAGGVLEMTDLPMAAHRRVSGATALLTLLSQYGEVLSLRGLVRDGEPTGRVRAVFARARAYGPRRMTHRHVRHSAWPLSAQHSMPLVCISRPPATRPHRARSRSRYPLYA